MEFVIGLIIFIADIWAIFNTVQARGPSAGAKILWIFLILILPVLGLIIWIFAGPRGTRERRL
jgi:hypothetical protein